MRGEYEHWQNDELRFEERKVEAERIRFEEICKRVDAIFKILDKYILDDLNRNAFQAYDYKQVFGKTLGMYDRNETDDRDSFNGKQRVAKFRSGMRKIKRNQNGNGK